MRRNKGEDKTTNEYRQPRLLAIFYGFYERPLQLL